MKGIHALNLLRRGHIRILRFGSVRVELDAMRHDDGT